MRLPLQSLPQTQVVDITAALHEMQGDAVRVTLVAVEPGEDGGPRVSDAFAAEEIRLVTYAGAGDTGPADLRKQPDAVARPAGLRNLTCRRMRNGRWSVCARSIAGCGDQGPAALTRSPACL